MRFKKGLLVTTIGLVILFMFVSSYSKNPQPNKSKPNIVLITIDSLNKNYLNTYNYSESTSPNLEGVGNVSYIFQNHITQSTYTFPSLTSLITSSYPRELGVLMPYNSTLGKSKKTLPEYLKGAGYKTYAINAGARLKKDVGLEQGFDYYKRIYPPHYANRHVNKVINRLEVLENNKSFFLWSHIYDVHCPYSPPKKYKANSDVNYTFNYRINNCKAKYKKSNLGKSKLNYIKENYRGEIRYVDEELGRFFDYLKRNNQFQNTLIIITADHGEEFYAHKYKFIGHGIDFYESIVNIPLMIKLPQQKTKRQVNYQTRNIDLLPTILDIVQIDYNKNEIAGKNIFDHNKPRVAFTEIEGRGDNRVSVRYKNYKYTNFMNRLFNLKRDPGETKNLIDERPSKKNRFINILNEWRQEHRQGNFTEESPVSEKIKKRLKELGYVQ